MNKKELRTKLIAKGVAPQTVPFIFRALTASNHTLVEFDGSKSEVFNGPDGVIRMKINTISVDLVGKEDGDYALPDTFIRVTDPKSYWGGYSTGTAQFEFLAAIQLSDGSIIATKAKPRALGLFSPTIMFYSLENVTAFVTENHERIEDVFDILFDGIPDSEVDLKCQRMSYRTPFEPSNLITLFDKNRKPIHKK